MVIFTFKAASQSTEMLSIGRTESRVYGWLRSLDILISVSSEQFKHIDSCALCRVWSIKWTAKVAINISTCHVITSNSKNQFHQSQNVTWNESIITESERKCDSTNRLQCKNAHTYLFRWHNFSYPNQIDTQFKCRYILLILPMGNEKYTQNGTHRMNE